MHGFSPLLYVLAAAALTPVSAFSSTAGSRGPCYRNGKEVPCTKFMSETRKVGRPVCQPVLRNCSWNPFSNWGCDGGSSCSGRVRSFYGLNVNGQCLCPEGTCVKDGKCVENSEFFKPVVKDPKKILCPVLASMYNAGGFDGMVDDLGRVSRLNVQKALVDTIGIANDMGFFFGMATAGYRSNDPQEVNQAFMPVPTAVAEYLAGADKEWTDGNARYLNIFHMAGNPEVLHSIAAGLRNPTTSETDPSNLCKEEFPCAARFDYFITPFADTRGRIYIKQLGELSRHIKANGEHGGVGLPFTHGGREWDALAGWMAGFGILDENAELYLPLDWARTMVLEGVFPKGWKKRSWGFPDVAEIERVGGFETQNIKKFNEIECAIGMKSCPPPANLTSPELLSLLAEVGVNRNATVSADLLI